ncbi:MAG: hypothetical protein ACM3UU_09145 [Ignavibacteriales bacterium]
MKKVLLVLISTMFLIFAAGCGNTQKVDSTVQQPGQINVDQAKTDIQNQTNGDVNKQASTDDIKKQVSTPEAKLKMEIASLGRLQRGDNALTQEQKNKIIPILKEISTKTAVDEKYSAQKIQEIEGVLIEAQKNSLNKRLDGNVGRRAPQAGANGSQQGQTPPSDSSMAPQGQQGRPDANVQNGEQRRMRGPGFGGPNMNSSLSLKIICENLINQLEGKQTQQPAQQAPIQQKQ